MTKRVSSTSIYHPDVILFLILIPFISAINYYLTYSNIKLNGFLVLTFAIDTLQGYAAWSVVRKLIFWFDKRLPYSSGILKRLAIQLIATTIIGLAVISLLTEFVSFIAKGKSAPLHFYTTDLFIIGIWFFFINAIYLGLYYYNQWKRTEEKILEEKKMKADGFVVRVGNKNVRLDFENILGLYADTDYTVAQSTSGEKFYLDDSLTKIENRLPNDRFFRLNRKYIVHRDMIVAFKRMENGKILVELQLNEFFPSEIPVSRTKAPSFKSWFRPNL
ncbi:LytR/AlgR family response regulator transcription factor [Maribacter sp. 2307UL18-2]|uniref:LytR/AlgR family response regulator transcription factor n=1 Tax=Maribacter sp. 2307UL18-2 TaxID=3386274 RepID=UPI0039BCA5DB